MTTYTSEPGTRLGGRYRLEDRIAAGSGWDAWKAIDETLARAVTVFTFAQGFPRITDVVTAARAASRLTDPRLAQVFDVEDAWDGAYVVMEWAAGETLGDLLSDGPLDPARGARMIAEAAAALSSAHAAGVAHMCLSPGSVRWSQTGEVKVVGLGIDAALSGTAADDPILADTRGLGRLLYAALTGCWPGADYPALPPAPVADGEPRSPRQVVAGIPMSFSDLACRAMHLQSREGSPPVVSPGEFASALMAALPPAPIPSAPPPPARRDRHADSRRDSADDPYWPGRERAGGDYTGGWRDFDERQTSGWPVDGQPAPEPGWAHYEDGPFGDRNDQAGVDRRGHRAGGRRGQRAVPLVGVTKLPIRVFAAAGALVVVAVVATVTLWPGGAAQRQPGGHQRTKKNVPTTSVTTLVPVNATGFDPLRSVKEDRSNENTQYARYAIDSSMRSAWDSQWYKTAEFGGLKTGAGLLLDMGKSVTFRSLTVIFGSIPGADVQILVGNSAARSASNLSSMTTVATADNVSGPMTFRLSKPAAGRFLVIWFTKLPPKRGSGHWFMAAVYNVSVKGS
ncbi:MAG TPA: protein kinase family protein [Streptosporangiaceae bacterium]|nr:protein kinase family protein [Streptosporangiaceae bacterium]